MDMLLIIVIALLSAIVLVLALKVYFLKKSAREIAEALRDRLAEDTNTLIDISSRDMSMRRLAAELTTQLRLLRRQRHRFSQGDRELKSAVTNISHDLRTPLTAICGYLELLRREKMSSNAARYIEIIQNRADMLTQLTDELFRYSVIMSSEDELIKEPVALQGVLEESIAAFYASLRERGIEPSIQMPEAPVIRHIDRAALSRILSNLIANALRYSDGDLDIVLSESGQITFSNTARALSGVQVCQLFDRFFTVETARQSTGLGLSIARTLAKRMNGAITAAYSGSTLTICLTFRE